MYTMKKTRIALNVSWKWRLTKSRPLPSISHARKKKQELQGIPGEIVMSDALLWTPREGTMELFAIANIHSAKVPRYDLWYVQTIDVTNGGLIIVSTGIVILKSQIYHRELVKCFIHL